MTDSTFPGATDLARADKIAASVGDELTALRTERDHWKKCYYDVADAVARESTSCEDLCRQAKETRTERDGLKAEVQRLREALDKFVDCQIAGGRAWDEPKLYEALHHAWDLIRKLDPPRVP